MGNYLAMGTDLEAFHGATLLQSLVLHLSPNQTVLDPVDLFRSIPNVRLLELGLHASQLADIAPGGPPTLSRLNELVLHVDLPPSTASVQELVQMIGSGASTLRHLQLCLRGATLVLWHRPKCPVEAVTCLRWVCYVTRWCAPCRPLARQSPCVAGLETLELTDQSHSWPPFATAMIHHACRRMKQLQALSLHVSTHHFGDPGLLTTLTGMTQLTRLEVDLSQARISKSMVVDLLDSLARMPPQGVKLPRHIALTVNGWLNPDVRGDTVLEALGRWRQAPVGWFQHVHLRLFVEDVSLTCAGIVALGQVLRSRIMEHLKVELFTNSDRWDVWRITIPALTKSNGTLFPP